MRASKAASPECRSLAVSSPAPVGESLIAHSASIPWSSVDDDGVSMIFASPSSTKSATARESIDGSGPMRLSGLVASSQMPGFPFSPGRYAMP